MDVLRTLVTLCLAGGLSLATGCSGSLGPVNNIENAPIYQNDGPMDTERVRAAIVAGLDDKGWGILDQSEGWILARVDDDDQWAKIRITYDTKSYTILHFESSPDLGYDGGQIHRTYNNWIEDLDEEIQDALKDEGNEDEDSEDQSVDDVVDGDGEDGGESAEDAADAVAPGEGPNPDPDPSWNDGAGDAGDAPPPT